MTRIAIFQPRPGLGDLIWHLPLIRAIASRAPTQTAILITKPSTQANVLLRDDPCIERIVAFDRNPRTGTGKHDGPDGFLRLVATLRGLNLDSCYLLHHGASLAAAMRLAGIPNRYGYGYSAAQRFWLNRGPFLRRSPVRRAEAFDQATAYAHASGFENLPEPAVPIAPEASAAVRARLSPLPRPWLALGIGCHGANRQWGPANYAALAARFLAHGPGSVLLLAGATEYALATEILDRLKRDLRVQAAIGWPLPKIVAVLAEAELFAGNDSGLMNLRAAVGKPAVGLFGASGPLAHSAHIIPVVPPGGARAGMEGISIEAVEEVLF
jgi:heptosyltransferase-2